MKVFRWVLIVLLAIYTVLAVGPWLFTLLYKLGVSSLGEDPSMRALMDGTNTPVMIAWTGMAVLYIVGLAMFALRRGRAWPVLVAAYALDVFVVLVTQSTEAYQSAFPPAQRAITWPIVIAVAVLIAAIGYVEGGRRPRSGLSAA